MLSDTQDFFFSSLLHHQYFVSFYAIAVASITQLLLPSEHQSSKQKEEREDGFTIWQTLFTFYWQKPGNMSIFRSRKNELTRTGLDQLWSFSEPHSLSSRNICLYLKKSAFRQQRKRPGEARGWENNSWCLLLNSLQKLTIIE